MELIERFLLYRVYGKSTKPAIDVANERSPYVAPTLASSRLTVGNAAVVGTEQALHGSVVQSLIVSALVGFQ